MLNNHIYILKLTENRNIKIIYIIFVDYFSVLLYTHNAKGNVLCFQMYPVSILLVPIWLNGF